LQFLNQRAVDFEVKIADGAVFVGGGVFVVQVDAAEEGAGSVDDEGFAVIAQIDLKLPFEQVGLCPTSDLEVWNVADVAKEAEQVGAGGAEAVVE